VARGVSGRKRAKSQETQRHELAAMTTNEIHAGVGDTPDEAGTGPVAGESKSAAAATSAAGREQPA
jgi:hypothetical protein